MHKSLSSGVESPPKLQQLKVAHESIVLEKSLND